MREFKSKSGASRSLQAHEQDGASSNSRPPSSIAAPCPIRFTRAICGDLGQAERREWWIANGLGGYRQQRPDLVQHVSRWNEEGSKGRRLFSLARIFRMTNIMRRLLDETEFLSPYGIRALSRCYLDDPYDFEYNRVHYRVKYLPGESDGSLFGGNSNWRGPIWMPVNYLLVENLRRFHQFYGDRLKIECPTGSGIMLTLNEIADELCRRLIKLFLRGPDGRRPVFGGYEKSQTNPDFKDYILFHEYFHGDNGRGCGASHQTGWTGLVANLIDQLVAEAPTADARPARTEHVEPCTVSPAA
jgi:hypothetical protein